MFYVALFALIMFWAYTKIFYQNNPKNNNESFYKRLFNELNITQLDLNEKQIELFNNNLEKIGLNKRLRLPSFKFDQDEEFTIKKVTKLNKVVYYLKSDEDVELITDSKIESNYLYKIRMENCDKIEKIIGSDNTYDKIKEHLNFCNLDNYSIEEDN